MKTLTNIRKKSDENQQKQRFPVYFQYFQPEKKFSQNSDSPMFWALLIRIFVQKSEKTNDEILRKWQKPVFLAYFRHISGIFPEFSAGKDFFSEIRLRHILGIAILHLCVKNQQKLVSQSREKLVTEERTNGRANNERTFIKGTFGLRVHCERNP